MIGLYKLTYLALLCLAPFAFAQPQPVIQFVGVNGPPNVVSPGGGAIINGINLADRSSSGPGDTKVLVNGVDSPIRSASPTSVNFYIPPQTPLGSVNFVVSNHGIASAAFQATVQQYTPVFNGNGRGTGEAAIFHADRSLVLSLGSPAFPGERLIALISGLGAADPPPVPSVTIGGFPVSIDSITHSDIDTFPGVYQITLAVPSFLTTGSYTLAIAIGGFASQLSPQLPVVATGLILSQQGATFRAVATSTASQQRSIAVVATSDVITWTATALTISGGNWLQVSPASGISDPSKSPPSIQIAASAASLSPGDYYGTVTIKPMGTNSSQIISAVLSVLPPNQSPGTTVEPTGLVFVTAPGAALPNPQTVQITNPTTATLSFTATPSVPSGSVWFKLSPGTAPVPPGQPVNITVQPSASLPVGIYPGTLTVQFSDGKTRVVNLLYVVAAGASPNSASPRDISSAAEAPSPQAGCTPTKLLPVFTLLGVNFTSPVAWPTPIQAQIVDDCGTPIKTGSVTLTFSNGDPALGLSSLQNGTWANTWVPRNVVTSSLVVTLKAQVVTPPLQGTTTVSGSAPPNPKVPIISSGGIVGTASYVASPAPGTLISLFGTALADGLMQANALPLPGQLGTTSLLIGGVTVPLVFVSDGQANALLPYGLKTKDRYQAIVQRGSAISAPETIAVLDAQPAVFTTDQTGKGQGHIYKIRPDGAQILAAPSAPAHAGDVLTIYCTGLGEVNPPVQAGVPAPLDTLEPTVNPVMVTIGGVNAQVLFSGLTPGFTGLYQINVVVPDGVPAGSSVPVAVSAAGQQSIPVSIAMQ